MESLYLENMSNLNSLNVSVYCYNVDASHINCAKLKSVPTVSYPYPYPYPIMHGAHLQSSNFAIE